MKYLNSTFILLFLIITAKVMAQDGIVDTTFNPADFGYGHGDGFYNNNNGGNGVPYIHKGVNGKILAYGSALTSYNSIEVQNLIQINSNGSLDREFNVPYFFGAINSAVYQNDGKLIIGGSINILGSDNVGKLIRLNRDGTFDPTFYKYAISGGAVNDIIMLSNGFVLAVGSFGPVAGHSTQYMAVFKSDGSVDTSFTFTNCCDAITDVIELKNGNYLAIAINKVFFVDKKGKVISSHVGGYNALHSIAVQSDGKILLAGHYISYDGNPTSNLIRINMDGTFDSTFHSEKNSNGFIYAIDVQSDDKIIIGGYFYSYDGKSVSNIARLHSDGQIDTSFKIGSGADKVIKSVQVDASDKILLSGEFLNFNGKKRIYFTQLNKDGSHDLGFNMTTGFNERVQQLFIDGNDNIYVSGWFNIFNGDTVFSKSRAEQFFRLSKDGTYDGSFSFNGNITSSVHAITSDVNDNVYLAGQLSYYQNGYRGNGIVKTDKNGIIDITFKTAAGLNTRIEALAIQSDGKILVGMSQNGSWTGTDTDNRMVRLNPNASLDNSFISGKGIEGFVNVIRVMKDGSIIAGGGIKKFRGDTVNQIIKLFPDGTLDSSFTSGKGFAGYINDLQIQNDGKIVVVGNFSSYRNHSLTHIVRLLPNGDRDSNFIPPTFDYNIEHVHLQRDGKIIVNGGMQNKGPIRLLNNGNIDSSFNSPVVDYGANDIAVQKDGNLVIGGNFTHLDGIGRNRIARLHGTDFTGICDTLKIAFKVTQDITCDSAVGKAFAFARHGNPPYSFEWSAVDSSKKDTAFFSNFQSYWCKVTDAVGCVDSAALVVQTPKYPLGVELETFIVDNEFRTGFTNEIVLTPVNNGCVSKDIEVKLVLDTAKTSFVSSNVAPNWSTLDTISWTISQINYQSHFEGIYVKIKTKNTAVIGDTIKISTITLPFIDDRDTSNNIKDYAFRVINGYDPNDITVHPTGNCPEAYIKGNQKLTYKIRFQNTGNAEAINIYVIDSIDLDLDISTLNVVSASDTLYSLIYPGNVIKFTFDSIFLADSASNEPKSHGYIVYTIEPKSTLPDGTKILNRADIYFDYNPPVLTNTTLNTIQSGNHLSLCTPTSAQTKTNGEVKVFPNPNDGVFTLESFDLIEEVIIYDHSSRTICRLSSNSKRVDVSLVNIKAGIYLVAVKTTKGKEVLKMIVQ